MIKSKNVGIILSKRKIIHIDMDAFFASVEQRDNPELQGKPIAVGGSRARGVVAAASYEARRFGVRSAMSSQKAAQLCPQLIFVKPRFEAYKEASNIIKLIFKKYTKLIEPLSLDEAYLDVTDLPLEFNSATELAEKIREDIFQETKLTASAGISFNKFLAKMSSDINKPNGQFVLTPSKAKDFLAQLEIRKFYGIGKVTAAKFQKMGILYGTDLQKQTLSFLEQQFGKSAKSYFNLSRGIDNRAVQPNSERKSIGAENTFINDIDNLEDLTQAMELIAKRVSERATKTNKKGRTVTIKVKYKDFSQITRSTTDENYKNDIASISKIAKDQLKKLENIEKGIRLLGISLSNFQNDKKEENIQLKLNL